MNNEHLSTEQLNSNTPTVSPVETKRMETSVRTIPAPASSSTGFVIFGYGLFVVLCISAVVLMGVYGPSSKSNDTAVPNFPVTEQANPQTSLESEQGVAAPERLNTLSADLVSEQVSDSLVVRRDGGGENVGYSSIGEEIPGPKVNIMSCITPSKIALPAGALACYGLWDSGDEFGNDAYMCPSGAYGQGKTGCVITTNACISQSAFASEFILTSRLNPSSPRFAEFASNLNVSTDSVRRNILGLWVYTCQ